MTLKTIRLALSCAYGAVCLVGAIRLFKRIDEMTAPKDIGPKRRDYDKEIIITEWVDN